MKKLKEIPIFTKEGKAEQIEIENYAINRNSDVFILKHGLKEFQKLKAKNYCELASSELEKAHLDKALTYYSEAIALDPENPKYYNRRALVYRRSNEAEKAAQDSAQEAKLLPPKSPLSFAFIPMRTQLIGGFLDIASLNAFLQVDKQHEIILQSLLDARRPFTQIEKEWNSLVKSEAMTRVFRPIHLQFCLESWLKNDLRTNEPKENFRRIHVLWHSTIMGLFALVRFLKDYGVNINHFYVYYSPHKINLKYQPYLQYLRRHGNYPCPMIRLLDGITLHSITDKKKPFLADKVLFLINLGARVNNRIATNIINGLSSLPQSDNPSAAQLVAFLLEKKFLTADHRLAQRLLINNKYQTHPLIHSIKIYCLLQHLKKLNNPASTNDHTDIISASIKRLEKISSDVNMTTHWKKKELLAIQRALDNRVSRDSPKNPSRLGIYLKNLKEVYPCLVADEVYPRLVVDVTVSHERKIKSSYYLTQTINHHSTLTASSSSSSSSTVSTLVFFPPPPSSPPPPNITPSSSSSISSSANSSSISPATNVGSEASTTSPQDSNKLELASFAKK